MSPPHLPAFRLVGVVVQEVTDAVASGVFRVFSDACFGAVFPEEIEVEPCLSFVMHGLPSLALCEAGLTVKV